MFLAISVLNGVNRCRMLSITWAVLFLVSQSVGGEPPFLVGGGSGRWFVDRYGVNVFTNTFEKALPFSEGFAAVRHKGKWGIIDTAGIFLAQCNYSYAGPFSGGFAIVSSNGLYGVINRSGEISVNISYSHLKLLGEGKFAAKISRKYGIIDAGGQVIIEPRYDDIANINLGVLIARTNAMWGAVDLNGNVSLPFEFARLGIFSEGIFAAQRKSITGVNYINSGGANVFEAVFVDGRSFLGGKAFVLGQTGKWGIIDKTGSFIVNPTYDDVGYPAFGYVSVKIGKRWGISATDGTLVVPAIYDRVSEFDQYGRALVVKAERSGYVATNGTVLVQLKAWK